MVHSFTHSIQVEFAHTDLAGIVYFARFFEYMEATEHAFFRSFGEHVHRQEGASVSGWVRAHAECDYLVPLRYPEKIDVHLKVERIGNKSLTYAFEFERVDPHPGETIARGKLVVVHLEGTHGEAPPQTAPIPASIAAVLSESPSS